MEFIDNTKKVLSSEESLLEKLAIGMVMTLASILIVPAFIYQGYLMKILEETGGEFPDGLPEWENFGELLKYGLISWGLSIVVSFASLVPSVVPELAGLGDAIVLASSVVGILISLTLSYLMIGIFAVGFRDGFSEAFTLHRLKPILFSTEYLAYWAVALVVGIAAGIVAIPLVLFTFGFGFLLLIPLFVGLNFVIMLLAGFAVTEAESSGATKNTHGQDPVGEL